MKKTFPVFLAVLIQANISFAQYIASSPASPDNKKEIELFEIPVTGPAKEALTISNVSINAVRDFVRSYKKAENVHWYLDPAGFFVYYSKNNAQGRTFYDKKGTRIYTMLSYPGKNLAEDIRDKVKTVYYLDDIIWVNEIQTDDKTVYIVHLEGKKRWKNVRICGDEMDTIEEFDKK